MIKAVGFVVFTLSGLAADFGGVGLVIIERGGTSGPLRTGSVYSGSPANRSGVTTNGFLFAVDGTNVATMSLTQAVSLVRGPVGAFVTLEIADSKMSVTNKFRVKRSRVTFSDHKVEFADE